MRAIAIAAAIALTYLNGLSGPFVLDDQASIVENESIRGSALQSVLAPPANSPVAGRPVVNVSFAINYAIGGLSVRGYHLWNIAMHIACALLTFGIVRRTLELPSLRARLGPHSIDLAFAVALVWAVHPLNSEVVDYLTQRTESMMGVFLLLTMYAALRAAMGPATSWSSIAFVSCCLGMACKETMVTAPVLVMLFDRAYVFSSWKSAFRARRGLYLSLATSWLVLAMLVLSGPRGDVGGWSSGVSVWSYLLNQAVAITDYLRLAMWPTSLVVFYGWPLSLTLGQVAVQVTVILALLATTAVALVRAPRWGFFGAWFFITLAPTSSIIAIATEVGAERRMYLPLLAVISLAVVIVHGLMRKTLRTAAAPLVVLVAVSVALATTTVARNREYASGVALAQTVVDRRPSGIAHHILGEQLLLAGRDEEAVTHFREAIARGDSRARYALGRTLFAQGKSADAIEQFDAFIRTAGVRLVPRWLEPPVVELTIARALMAELLVREQRWSEAVAQARLVLETVPAHMAARRVLATAVFGLRQWAEAVERYRDYLSAQPRDAEAFSNLGIALVATGRIDEAIDAFRRAMALDPANPGAKRLLEMAIRDRDGAPQ